MARDQRNKLTIWAVSGALLLLLAVTIGTISNRDTSNSPRPIPDQALDNSPRATQPAHLSDIQDALQATDRAIVETSWDQAESHADRAKELWLSYRTPMQASAGRRMWSTDLSQHFQSTLEGLRADIAARQSQRARAKIRELSEIIDGYDDENERYDVNRGVEDDTQSRSQTTPQAD